VVAHIQRMADHNIARYGLVDEQDDSKEMPD
jgi:hypothetical protein